MSDMFEGVFTALVTPFRDGEIDEAALADLIERQIEGGVHGLVPCGTTGESSTLGVEEHDRVIQFVVSRVSGRVPVLAGAGSNSTEEAAARTRAAREAGADGVLQVLPYYNRPTPRGIVEHFRRVAEVGLPVMVYNIPSRCAVGLDLETYGQLAEIPGIVATKEASGDLGLMQDVLALGRLRVLSGDDALTFPLLCLGGHGVVSVLSNLAPRRMVDLFDHAREGHVEDARSVHSQLRPLFRALFLESNPAPVKAAMAHLGWMEETVRPPLVPVSEATRARVVEALESCLEPQG